MTFEEISSKHINKNKHQQCQIYKKADHISNQIKQHSTDNYGSGTPTHKKRPKIRS